MMPLWWKAHHGFDMLRDPQYTPTIPPAPFGVPHLTHCILHTQCARDCRHPQPHFPTLQMSRAPHRATIPYSHPLLMPTHCQLAWEANAVAEARRGELVITQACLPAPTSTIDLHPSNLHVPLAHTHQNSGVTHTIPYVYISMHYFSFLVHSLSV